ncbi:MAG: hypothetical protein AAGF12_08375 [Myxococcota bacterium]
MNSGLSIGLGELVIIAAILLIVIGVPIGLAVVIFLVTRKNNDSPK